MYCYFCGKENKDEQNFCKYCGQKLHLSELIPESEPEQVNEPVQIGDIGLGGSGLYRILNFIRNSGFVLDQVLLKAGPCHAERMISECISLFAFRKSYISREKRYHKKLCTYGLSGCGCAVDRE